MEPANRSSPTPGSPSASGEPDSCRFSSVAASAPKKISGQSGNRDDETDECALRIVHKSAHCNQPLRRNEKERRPGMSRHAKIRGRSTLSMGAAAKDEKTNGSEAEEDAIHRDNIIHDLRVRSRERDHDRPQSLQ